MKKIFAFVIALTLMMSVCAFAEGVTAPTAAETVANVRPAIVSITAVDETWDDTEHATVESELGSGTGMFFTEISGKGYVICGYDCVTNSGDISIAWSDGTETKAELVGRDFSSGIAVLSFEGKAPAGVTSIVIGDSDALSAGENVLAIGNINGKCPVSSGIVSYVEYGETAGNIGNRVTNFLADVTCGYGAVIINAAGEFVGIAEKDDSGFVSCIPVNEFIAETEEIITNGKVSRPMLGLGVIDYDGPDEPIRSHAPIGVMVKQVSEGSSAEEEGILVYDVITEIDGVRVKSGKELTGIVAEHAVGDRVTLKIYRYYDEDGNMLSKYEEHEFEIELRALEQ